MKFCIVTAGPMPISIEPVKNIEDTFPIFEDVSPDIRDFKSSRVPLLIARILSTTSFLIKSEEKPICVCWIRQLKKDSAILGFVYSNDFMKNQGKGITYLLRDKLNEYAGQYKQFEIHSLLSHEKSKSWYGAMGFNETDESYTDTDGNRVTVFVRKN